MRPRLGQATTDRAELVDIRLRKSQPRRRPAGAEAGFRAGSARAPGLRPADLPHRQPRSRPEQGRPHFGGLGRPTLVIHGAADELVPPQASAPLAALDNVDRKLFAGLRHEIHNEPEHQDVLGLVVAWLNGHLA